jgi:hypothetical protein
MAKSNGGQSVSLPTLRTGLAATHARSWSVNSTFSWPTTSEDHKQSRIAKAQNLNPNIFGLRVPFTIVGHARLAIIKSPYTVAVFHVQQT